MGPHTQVEGIVGEEERKFSTASSAEEVVPVRNAGAEFASTLSWLPERSSVEAFAPRGEKVARKLKGLVDRIDAAYTQTPALAPYEWTAIFIDGTWTQQ